MSSAACRSESSFLASARTKRSCSSSDSSRSSGTLMRRPVTVSYPRWFESVQEARIPAASVADVPEAAQALERARVRIARRQRARAKTLQQALELRAQGLRAFRICAREVGGLVRIPGEVVEPPLAGAGARAVAPRRGLGREVQHARAAPQAEERLLRVAVPPALASGEEARALAGRREEVERLAEP